MASARAGIFAFGPAQHALSQVAVQFMALRIRRARMEVAPETLRQVLQTLCHSLRTLRGLAAVRQRSDLVAIPPHVLRGRPLPQAFPAIPRPDHSERVAQKIEGRLP